MTLKRPRPAGCCEEPVVPRPLAADEEAARVRLFRALGDETRLGILRLLAANPEPLCVCDIVDQFPLGQPTISHHLKLLRQAGLVTAARRGIWAYYALDPRGLEAVRATLGDLGPACRRRTA